MLKFGLCLSVIALHFRHSSSSTLLAWFWVVDMEFLTASDSLEFVQFIQLCVGLLLLGKASTHSISQDVVLRHGASTCVSL